MQTDRYIYWNLIKERGDITRLTDLINEHRIRNGKAKISKQRTINIIKTGEGPMDMIEIIDKFYIKRQ